MSGRGGAPPYAGELSEVPDRIGRGPGDGSRAVAIGGGHGLSRCLQALTHVVDHVTAVVTTADDGGSSGRLRRELGVIPPGDLRMALASLSPRRDLTRLIQYRFGSGELEGHSLGNLLIVATTDLNGGDIVAALDYVASVLDARGRVLPCSNEPVILRARVGGEEVAGQVAIARSRKVEEVWLDPSDPPATSEAVEAIARADLVVLGPGSLFTSVVPNLLVPGIRESVAAATCPVVLVANLREQRGETEGLTLVDTVERLLVHAAGIELDAIVAHDGPPDPAEGAPLQADLHELRAFAPTVLLADLVDPRGGHSPSKLAVPLGRLLRPGRAAFG